MHKALGLGSLIWGTSLGGLAHDPLHPSQDSHLLFLAEWRWRNQIRLLPPRLQVGQHVGPQARQHVPGRHGEEEAPGRMQEAAVWYGKTGRREQAT